MAHFLFWVASSLAGFSGIVCSSVGNDEAMAGRRAAANGWYWTAIFLVVLAVAFGRNA